MLTRSLILPYILLSMKNIFISLTLLSILVIFWNIHIPVYEFSFCLFLIYSYFLLFQNHLWLFLEVYFWLSCCSCRPNVLNNSYATTLISVIPCLHMWMFKSFHELFHLTDLCGLTSFTFGDHWLTSFLHPIHWKSNTTPIGRPFFQRRFNSAFSNIQTEIISASWWPSSVGKS